MASGVSLRYLIVSKGSTGIHLRHVLSFGSCALFRTLGGNSGHHDSDHAGYLHVLKKGNHEDPSGSWPGDDHQYSEHRVFSAASPLSPQDPRAGRGPHRVRCRNVEPLLASFPEPPQSVRVYRQIYASAPVNTVTMVMQIPRIVPASSPVLSAHRSGSR